MHHRLVTLVIFLFPLVVFAQSDPLLDGYIQEAMENNQSLQRQYLEWAQAEARQREARNLFFPTVAIDARFSRAAGGRMIDFPVGDLVNPVYENLNLINGIGASTNPAYPEIPEYPTIDNVSEPFLRPQEHETRVRLIQPLYNPSIIRNYAIQRELHALEGLRVQSGQRELVESVKRAYYQYAQSAELLHLYEATLELVEENLRTTESLFNYHKVSRDAVYAAEVQVAEVELELAEAIRQEKTARAYFNFLLQRAPDAEIELGASVDAVLVPDLEDLYAQALSGREELQQLSLAASVNEQQLKLERGSYLPTLSLAADYGFQGVEYTDFGPEDDFVMASLLVQWSLFDGTANARMQQAKIEQEITANRSAELADQIVLQVLDAYYRYEAAIARRTLSESQVVSAGEAYRMVAKRFEQGQSNLIELTEARTRQTQAEQQLIIARYEVYIQLAMIEKVCATYPVN
jgi:outer membrane protein